MRFTEFFDPGFSVDVDDVDLASTALIYVLKIVYHADNSHRGGNILTRVETLDLPVDVVFDEPVHGIRSVHGRWQRLDTSFEERG
jgi:hypothetical protein